VYDTVRLVLPTPDRSLDRIVSGLESVKKQIDLDTGAERFAGYVSGLMVRVTERRTQVYGSLPRFLGNHGWNEASPSREDVRAVHAILETRLGVPMGEAQMWRLDLFADLMLEASPAVYLPLLLSKDRCQRSEYEGTSVQFNLDRRQVAFYDKAAERRIAWPGGLLRYELRYLNRLTEQMGRVFLADLHDSARWGAFVSAWEDEYASVKKGNEIVDPEGPFDWRSHQALTAAMSVGPGRYIQFYKDAYKAGQLTRSQYHSARKSVLKALSDPVLTAPSSRVEELDRAVAEAAAFLREQGR